MTSKPVALIILDGFGVAPPSVGNAITSAKSKDFEYLFGNYPALLLQASGAAVGLPWGKMGNSEVGHLTIGAGQVCLQSLENINMQISRGDFFQNQALLKAVNHVKNNKANLHLLGLLGDGGVHAHQGHLLALLELAKQNSLHNKTFLHLFLDGRDTAKDSGLKFLTELTSEINKLGVGRIASLGGRFFGMDRNKNWERVQKSYETMIGRSSLVSEEPLIALKDSYNQKIYDEEFTPMTVVENNKPVGAIKDNDAVIFYNFRADRARQLSQAFAADKFDGFSREKIKNLLFVGFTEYDKELPIEAAFSKPKIEYPLARIVSEAGLRQLHIAETEKYAHVTFFINGLKEEPFSREERVLIPSPAVKSYDERPEMSAEIITEKVIAAVASDKFDFYLINFANPDMVGHTGNLEAGIRAIEKTGEYLLKIIKAIADKGGQAIITADHGNVEEMINLETRQIDKEHSNFPVPLVIVKEDYFGKTKARKIEELYNLKIKGTLIDVAPTALAMLGLPKYQSMLGIDLNKIIV